MLHKYWSWESLVSWVFLKEGNQVGSVLFSSQTSEWHFVTGDVFTWVQQIDKQVLFTPVEASSFQSLTGWEVSASCWSTYKSSKSWSGGILVITLILNNEITAKAWQAPQFYSKTAFPKPASPFGIVTSGYLIYFFFLPPICILINKNYNFVD